MQPLPPASRAADDDAPDAPLDEASLVRTARLVEGPEERPLRESGGLCLGAHPRDRRRSQVLHDVLTLLVRLRTPKQHRLVGEVHVTNVKGLEFRHPEQRVAASIAADVLGDDWRRSLVSGYVPASAGYAG